MHRQTQGRGQRLWLLAELGSLPLENLSDDTQVGLEG